MTATLWHNHTLIRREEVIGHYRNSVLGILLSFLHSVFMSTIYAFVFSVVFKAPWSGGGNSKTGFALTLFAGVMVFILFATSLLMRRNPTLMST